VMAGEVIKLLTEIGEPLSGKVWIWDVMRAEGRVLKMGKG